MQLAKRITNMLNLDEDYFSHCPMHIGNAREGTIGDGLAECFSFSGFDVCREFYMIKRLVLAARLKIQNF